MKKYRGKRRYYRKLKARNDSNGHFFNAPLDDDMWFDFWHTHYDWSGLGNYNWKSRRSHLDALFRNFEFYVELLSKWDNRFQLFIQIYNSDSTQDAIFIHTENPNFLEHPNHTKFPFQPNVQIENILTNKNLVDYLDSQQGFERYYYPLDEEGGVCLLYRKGIGEPLVVK